MNDQDLNLSGEATRGTISTAAAWLGWILLGLLAVVTAVHAITLVQAHTHLSASGGNIFNIIRVGGVVLVELFAVVTAILLATHKLRARQKPAAMAVEATWFVFAAVNLVSSFAVEAGGPTPSFVATWVTYGLPVSALVMGALFYLTLRLDPDAARADDEAETVEMFARVRHQARQEVLASPQMRATIRQAEWMRLPAVVGRQMNLSQRQIDHLTRQAPELLDLNQNGIADIHEHQPPQDATPRLAYPVGNNTQSPPRYTAADGTVYTPAELMAAAEELAKGKGQGNGPAARKLGADGAPPDF